MSATKHTYTNNSSLAMDTIRCVIENENDILEAYLMQANTERIRNTAFATLLFMVLNLTNPDCWATWFTLVGASVLTVASIAYIITVEVRKKKHVDSNKMLYLSYWILFLLCIFPFMIKDVLQYQQPVNCIISCCMLMVCPIFNKKECLYMFGACILLNEAAAFIGGASLFYYFAVLVIPFSAYFIGGSIQGKFVSVIEEQENEKKLMLRMYDALPTGFAVFEVVRNHGVITMYLSDKIKKLLGYDVSDLKGNIRDQALVMIHPEDAPRLRQGFAKCSEGEASFETEVRVKSKNGAFHWLNLNATVADRYDDCALLLVVYTDIQKRKEAEIQTATMISSIDGGIVMLEQDENNELVIQYISDGFKRMLDYDEDYMDGEYRKKGKGIDAGIHPDDVESVRKKYADAVETVKGFKAAYRISANGKNYIWCGVNASTYENDKGRIVIYATYTDITEEMRQRERYWENEQKLAFAIEGAQMMIWDYYPGENKIIAGALCQKNCDCAAVIENWPYSWFEAGILHQNSRGVCHDALDQLHSGVSFVSCDLVLRVNHVYKWHRLNFRALYGKELGIKKYVCSAVTIEDYKELETRFIVAMKQSDLDVWVYDIKSRTLIQNSDCESLPTQSVKIENPREALVKAGLVYKDDIEAFQSIYDRVHRGDKEVSGEFRRVNRDGKGGGWMRIRYTVLEDANGEPSIAWGSLLNINGQRTAQQRYMRELQRRNSIVKDLIGYATLNVTRMCLVECKVNPATGLSITSATSIREAMDMICAYLPESRQREAFYAMFNQKALAQAYKNDQEPIYEFCFVNNEGNEQWVRLTVNFLKDPQEKEVLAFVYASDITERKISEQVIYAAASCDYDLLGHLNLKTGKIRMFVSNTERFQFDPKQQSYELLCKYYSEMGVHISDGESFLHDTRAETVREILEKKDAYEVLLHIREKDGTQRTKNMRFTDYRPESGFTLLTVVDVTEMFMEQEKRREELIVALESARQATRAKSVFLANMSHDLRTPMNAIIGITDIMEEEDADKEKMHEDMAVIRQSSKHLLALIDDILDMSRMESGKMVFAEEAIDLKEQIDTIEDMTRHLFISKQQKLSINWKNVKYNRIREDEIRFRRVFINLLSNASKYTQDGGEITLDIEEKTSKDAGKIDLIISVKDNGIGIPLEKQSKIFEMFERDSAGAQMAEGNGLGLAIVKSIVEARGGTIKLESEPGKGSIFTVEIPETVDTEREDIPEEKQNDEEIASDYSLQGRHILVAEDHAVNQMIALRLLEKHGAIVDIARDGMEALGKFKSSGSGTFDFILMDAQMPVMNGYEATKAIRNCGHPDAESIPIIAMTANTFSEDGEKAKDSGMNEHITKPIDLNKIINAMGRIMRS